MLFGLSTHLVSIIDHKIESEPVPNNMHMEDHTVSIGLWFHVSIIILRFIVGNLLSQNKLNNKSLTAVQFSNWQQYVILALYPSC